MRKSWSVAFCLCSFVFGIFAPPQRTLASQDKAIEIGEDAGSQRGSSRDNSGSAGEIQVIIGDHPTPALDQDWPIVHHETNEYVDPETGASHVVTTVIREGPERGLGAADESEICRQILGISESLEASGQAAAATGCSFVRTTSRESTDILSYGGTRVEHHLKSIADLYYGPRGNYYKLTQIHVWWKRTSTKWTVKNASMVFGCPLLCPKCDGSEFKGKRSATIGTPIWKDSFNSAKYILTGDFPPLWNGISCELGGAPQAGSLSEGYYGGVKRGTMMPSVCWN